MYSECNTIADMINVTLLKTVEHTRAYSLLHTNQNNVWVQAVDGERKSFELLLYDKN